MEAISSLLDNIKTRLTNPLFGTLIFVWCIRNFDFLFSLFNFDSGTLLSEKIIYITNYYKDKFILLEFIINISIAFGLLIIGYGFVVISRLLMNYVYQKTIPFLNKKYIDDKIFTVDKGRFDIVKKQRDDSYSKVLELNEIIVGLEQSNTEFKSKNIELEGKIKFQNIDINTLNNKIDSFEKEIKEIRTEKIILETSFSETQNELIKAVQENKKLQDFIDDSKNIIEKYNFEKLSSMLDDENISKSEKNYSINKTNSTLNITIKIDNESIKIANELTKQNILYDFYRFAQMIINNDTEIAHISNIEKLNFQTLIDMKLIKVDFDREKYMLTELGKKLVKFKPFFTT